MVKEKQVLGIIQEKTGNSIKVLNLWIKFFDEDLIENFNKDDNVEVNYLDNEKNGKIYHNGKSIKLRELTLKTENKDKLLPKIISDSTINCILMQSLQLRKELNIDDLAIATDKVINAYKKIIREI